MLDVLLSLERSYENHITKISDEHISWFYAKKQVRFYIQKYPLKGAGLYIANNWNSKNTYDKQVITLKEVQENLDRIFG